MQKVKLYVHVIISVKIGGGGRESEKEKKEKLVNRKRGTKEEKGRGQLDLFIE